MDPIITNITLNCMMRRGNGFVANSTGIGNWHYIQATLIASYIRNNEQTERKQHLQKQKS